MGFERYSNQPLQCLAGRDDRDALYIDQGQQITLIARNQKICSTAKGSCQDVIIVGVGG